MSDLRERVAKAMCDAVNCEGTWEETGTLHREKVWLVSADAAIALVLGEAAKVIGVKLFNRSCTCGFEAAAAIRALNAWPGVRMMVDIDTGDDAAIKLPLPQEKPDGE